MIANPDYVFPGHGLSPQYGFLPSHPPLQRLSNDYYEPWEVLIDNLSDLTNQHSVRNAVDSLPILDADRLTREEEWRRAYSVLSFLTHAYVWGGDQPSQRIPPPISRPFRDVSDHFDLPQVATFASLGLWNFAPRFAGADLTLPENLRSLITLTGTLDEEWFYVVSIAIEAEGAKIIPVVLECFQAVAADDAATVARLLKTIGACIQRLGQILDRMHERCDPEIFYHRIRPILAGSKGMQLAGLPRGVFYDEGAGEGSWRQYSGGSNAQSSLIQLLDIVLGVKHGATSGQRSESASPGTGPKHAYIEEMRRYMPLPHRLFLHRALSAAKVREYATRPEANADVQAAYKDAVASLTEFRDRHIRIVARYIVAPSRKASLASSNGAVNLATVSALWSGQSPEGDVQLRGTGGTNLMPFLKQVRDETKSVGRV